MSVPRFVFGRDRCKDFDWDYYGALLRRNRMSVGLLSAN